MNVTEVPDGMYDNSAIEYISAFQVMLDSSQLWLRVLFYFLVLWLGFQIVFPGLDTPAKPFLNYWGWIFWVRHTVLQSLHTFRILAAEKKRTRLFEWIITRESDLIYVVQSGEDACPNDNLESQSPPTAGFEAAIRCTIVVFGRT